MDFPYPLNPAPNTYFVSHEADPQKIADLRDALQSGLTNHGQKLYAIDHDIWGGELLCKIATKIQTTDFSIFDLPESIINPQSKNVYIELGIAIGLGKPIFLIQSDTAQTPSLLEGLERVVFTGYRNLEQSIGEKIRFHQPTNFLMQNNLLTNTYLLAEGEFNKEDFRYSIEDGLKNTNFKPIYIDTVIDSNFTLTQLIEHIASTRFGIYRVDGKSSANTFLALGIAIGLSKPWLFISQDRETIPSDLRGLSVLKFKSFSDLKTRVYEYCKNLFNLFYKEDKNRLYNLLKKLSKTDLAIMCYDSRYFLPVYKLFLRDMELDEMRVHIFAFAENNLLQDELEQIINRFYQKKRS